MLHGIASILQLTLGKFKFLGHLIEIPLGLFIILLATTQFVQYFFGTGSIKIEPGFPKVLQVQEIFFVQALRRINFLGSRIFGITGAILRQAVTVHLAIDFLHFRVQLSNLFGNTHGARIVGRRCRLTLTGRMFPGAADRTGRPFGQMLLDNIRQDKHIVFKQALLFIKKFLFLFPDTGKFFFGAGEILTCSIFRLFAIRNALFRIRQRLHQHRTLGNDIFQLSILGVFIQVLLETFLFRLQVLNFR